MRPGRSLNGGSRPASAADRGRDAEQNFALGIAQQPCSGRQPIGERVDQLGPGHEFRQHQRLTVSDACVFDGPEQMRSRGSRRHDDQSVAGGGGRPGAGERHHRVAERLECCDAHQTRFSRGDHLIVGISSRVRISS